MSADRRFEGLLQVERDGRVMRVALDRPHKRNALDDEAVLALEACFSEVPDDVGAVILHANGDDFCAGLDLSELSERNAAEGVAHSRLWHRAFLAIEFGRVPVVAVLKGAVIGGGLELAAAVHIRVAEESAFYALPEGQRGIFVGGGGSVRIPRLIGVARMADMMLTGRTCSAAEGLAINASQYLVPRGEGMAKAEAIAAKMAANAPMTNFAVIQALPRIADSGRDAGYLLEALVSAMAQADEEAKRRVRAFLDKKAEKVRAPQ